MLQEDETREPKGICMVEISSMSSEFTEWQAKSPIEGGKKQRRCSKVVNRKEIIKNIQYRVKKQFLLRKKWQSQTGGIMKESSKTQEAG